MGKKRTGKPTGAPPIQLDKKKFESMCAQQCTLEDVACEFDVDENTVEAWCQRTYGHTFSVVFARKRRKGYMSLRSSLFDEAVNQRTTAILIHLSKHYLNMVDRSVNENVILEATPSNDEDNKEYVAAVYADLLKRRTSRP